MKHKRTKATDITKQVRMDVGIRDDGLCIICGLIGIPNAHFIPRSQGGLGIEKNIVTLCTKCHHDFDNGHKRKENGEKIENYLRNCYGENWDKDKLIFKKYNY